MMRKIYLKKMIRNGFLICSILIITAACEEFVEIDSPTNQINQDDVFKDTHTVNAALSDIYSKLRDQSIFSGTLKGLGAVLDTYTDNLECFEQEGENSQISDVYRNNVMVTNQTVSSLWSTSYKQIYSINAFIEGLEESSSIIENDKIVFLGEAYLLRALCYHYLTQLFGDVPYTTTTDYNYNSKISKTNQLDVLAKIEADLKLALELLPTDYRHSERIYPNQAVAELLLAKNYLLQKQYDKAALFSKKVLDNSFYRLEQDLEKVFKKTAQSTLWQFNPSVEGVGTHETKMYIIVSGPPNLFALSEDLMRAYSNADLRKVHWIGGIEEGENKWYYPFKYQKTNNQNTDENSIIFRLEDAYFTYIESLLYLDRISEAIPFVNEIKSRANVDLLDETMSNEDFKREMIKEMRLEFVTEHGHRFFDLKRNGMLDVLKNVKPNWNQNYNILPIPDSELLLNSNLFPQNEGY